MNAFTSRRAAASCGALALLLGVGALVPLSAQADGLGGLTNTVTGATAPVTGAVTGVTGSTPVASSAAPTLGTVVTAVTDTTGLTSGSNGSTGSTGNVLGVVDLNTGTAATPSSGIGVPGVVSVDTTGLLGSGSTGSGSSTGGTTGSTAGSGSGGLGVTVGSDGAGGSLLDVDLGGTGGTTGSGGGSGSGSGGGTTTSTTTTTGGSTTNSSSTGGSTSGTTGGSTTGGSTTGTTDTTPVVPGAPTVPAAPTESSTPAAPAVVKVISVGASPSVGTVYPAKDGYRDDVVFRVAARLSSAAKTAVSGTAVLTRGTKAITQWTISQPTQDLRWNGLDHGKLVAGTYVLTATVKDATGATHTTTTKVVASPKRLVPSTQRVKSLSVSGKHSMASAARSGLGKGTVTLRLTTVAPKVEGKQFLIFQKGTKQLKVRILQGTRTSKAVVVPKELTSYTLKHTWKKGQVKLKSIRYTYSYQALR